MPVSVAPPLTLPPTPRLPLTPFGFVLHVALGRYRWLLLLLVVCEAINAGCGILLPYTVSQIISGVTSHGDVAGVWTPLRAPLFLFVGLCAGELLFGRINSALQLRVAPRQRQYIARAFFAYLHRHSHRFLSESFAGALAHRICCCASTIPSRATSASTAMICARSPRTPCAARSASFRRTPRCFIAACARTFATARRRRATPRWSKQHAAPMPTTYCRSCARGTARRCCW